MRSRVDSITSTEQAEAYRQLARGRYLGLRLVAALITAAAGAAIGAAASWVFAEPSSLSMTVAIIPILAPLAAQFMLFMSEQYDALSDRYAERGKTLAEVAATPVGQITWRQRLMKVNRGADKKVGSSAAG